MRKFGWICLAAIICISCRARDLKNTDGMQPQYSAESGSEVTYTGNYIQQIEPVYESDADRYRQNISVKAMGDDFVVYEYVDVRIDQIATLASRFCYETNPGKKAYLRDIYMQKNRKRRATFDCVNLATE